MARGGIEPLRAAHDAFTAPLLRYATSLCGDATLAEDIVQEALLRAWRDGRILHRPAHEQRAWLFRVAHNLVVDEFRSARRRHELEVERLPERAAPDRVDAVFEGLIVEEALAGLSHDHRAVVLHAYYLGRSVAETSVVLGIPEGTVKSRLHYALKALRLRLQELGMMR